MMITITKDMEVGVAKIDTQHRELFDRLNRVIGLGAGAVSKEETQRTLDLLGDYVIEHFGDEEELQRQTPNYPKYEWHKGQHQLYINEIRKLKMEFASNGVSAKFTLELNNSIVNWIVKHIKTVDTEFGKYYRNEK
jgi:hemerythrin